MSDPYIGEIRIFGFTKAFRNWAFCKGQTIPVSQSPALFAIIGTIYGGDGQSKFKLPDLQGRATMHYGQGRNLSSYALGKKGGSETVELNKDHLSEKGHKHCLLAADSNANSSTGKGLYLAKGNTRSGKEINPWPSYVNAKPMLEMNEQAIAPGGNGKGHNNMQPYIAMNFCMAVSGLFPPRG